MVKRESQKLWTFLEVICVVCCVTFPMLSGDLVKVIDCWSWEWELVWLCLWVETRERRDRERDWWQGQTVGRLRHTRHAGAGSPGNIGGKPTSIHPVWWGDVACIEGVVRDWKLKALHHGDRSQGRPTDLEWPCDGLECLEDCHSPSPWEERPCDVHHDVWLWLSVTANDDDDAVFLTLNYSAQRRVRKCCSLMSARSGC